MSIALGWEEIAKLPRAVAGGKAATLARLGGLRGARVLPAAWVGASFRRAADQVLRALDGHPRLIVRSSAAAEDGTKTSLAGHFSSVLCAAEPRALAAALEEVHEHAQRVFATMRRGAGSKGIGLLVQPALQAERSCVYFTESPLHRGRAQLSAAFGTCHAIVDGSLPCDTYVLDRGNIESQRVAHKFEMTWLHEGGACGQPLSTPLGPSWLHHPYGSMLWTARVPRGLTDAPALDADQLARVAALGAVVQERLGYPPDLELSFAGRALVLLQARPITKAAPQRKVALEGELQVASPGLARGPVRVVRSFADAAHVRRGDVVAVGATDPEYLPMLRKAAAVLSEEGSALTHTAIVARELGVPCLVGVEGATTGRFHDGQVVTVDAWRGRASVRRAAAARPLSLPAPAGVAASELIAEVAYTLGSAACTSEARALLKGRRARWDCAAGGGPEAEAWRAFFAGRAG